MSFALRPQEGDSVRTVVASRAGEAPSETRMGGDKDTRRVQEILEDIKQIISDVRKGAQTASAGSGPVPDRQSMLGAYQAARRSGDEARGLLQQVVPTVDADTMSEQSSHRLRHQKLSESLNRVSEELESTWRAFETAEATAAARAAKPPPVQAAAASPAGPASAGPGEDPELGQCRMHQQALVTLTQAELDLHTADVIDYADRVGAVATGVNDMRRCLLDLAAHTKAQGEMIDCIETHMADASRRTGQAVEQMQITSTSQQASMKWLLWVLTVAVLLTIAMSGFLLLRRQ